jgi:hypothetical protein
LDTLDISIAKNVGISLDLLYLYSIDNYFKLLVKFIEDSQAQKQPTENG